MKMNTEDTNQFVSTVFNYSFFPTRLITYKREIKFYPLAAHKVFVSVKCDKYMIKHLQNLKGLNKNKKC